MNQKPLTIRVQCHAGYMGEETPRRFYIGTRPVKIVAIIDRWLAPDHRYFKVIGDDGGTYIIRHDTFNRSWELTMYEKKGIPDIVPEINNGNGQ